VNIRRDCENNEDKGEDCHSSHKDQAPAKEVTQLTYLRNQCRKVRSYPAGPDFTEKVDENECYVNCYLGS